MNLLLALALATSAHAADPKPSHGKMHYVLEGMAETGPEQMAVRPDLGAICSADQSTIVQRTKLNFEPNYFAKLFAEKNWASVIVERHTYLVNLETGKLTLLEGTYDPVPSPDEKFVVTIENGSSVDDGPLYFETADVIGKPQAANGVYERYQARDYNLEYAYQSLGWLQSAATGPFTYRFLCDNDKGTVYFRDDAFVGNPLALQVGKWIPACTNLSSTFKLPMISKDGKHISVYNVTRGVTQIYDVDSKGVCTNGRSLPFVTGKADFSFDSNEVAFHMGRIQEPSQWFETADPARHLDTYTYNLTTKRLTRLTDVGIGNAYFPTFKKNGQVGFLLQDISGSQRKYSYVISDPSHGVELDQFPDLQDKTNSHLDSFSELVGIGLLKDNVCKKSSTRYTLESESAVPLTLTHDQCVSLIANYWDTNKDAVVKMVAAMHATVSGRKALIGNRLKTITHDELISACSAKDLTAVVEAPVVATQVITNSADPAQRLQATCTKCHGGDHPMSGLKFDLANPMNNSADLRAKMAKKIAAGEMPPGGLNESERGKLEGYLLGRAPASTR